MRSMSTERTVVCQSVAVGQALHGLMMGTTTKYACKKDEVGGLIYNTYCLHEYQVYSPCFTGGL